MFIVFLDIIRKLTKAERNIRDMTKTEIKHLMIIIFYVDYSDTNYFKTKDITLIIIFAFLFSVLIICYIISEE